MIYNNKIILSWGKLTISIWVSKWARIHVVGRCSVSSGGGVSSCRLGDFVAVVDVFNGGLVGDLEGQTATELTGVTSPRTSCLRIYMDTICFW